MVHAVHVGGDDEQAQHTVHRARQIYDVANRYLITPKLFSARRGDGGYWGDFDWNRAAEEGMREVGLPYSGSFAFAETEMTWPLNHMVAPKNEAVSCAECPTRQGGRLAGLGDFYMPGRDRNPWVDGFGWGLLSLTLLGVVVHGGGRIVASRRRGKEI